MMQSLRDWRTLFTVIPYKLTGAAPSICKVLIGH